jgi:hypothetical protein
MKKYALVKDGKVVNVILADSKIETEEEMVELEEGSVVGIDWDYNDGQFTDNRPVPEM